MSFFTLAPGSYQLDAFDLTHNLTLLFIMAMIAAIIAFRKKIRNTGFDKHALKIATVIALILEIGYHIQTIHTDFLVNLIPLDLCAITLWVSVALALSGKKWLFELGYFWAIGAIASVLYPNDGGLGADKFRFYHYFGVHTFIILVAVYYIAVRGYRIRMFSFLKAIGVLFPITIVVRVLDLALQNTSNPNWMFLAFPPDISSPLDLLPKGGLAYYFAFILLGIVIMFIAYLPWGIVAVVTKIRTRSRVLNTECCQE